MVAVVTRAAWLVHLQERPGRPQGRQHRQLDVLIALADQLDAKTGEGAVSLLELVKIAGVSERTARRAIGWATTSGLLQRTSRGHRLGDGTTAASGWLLLGNPGPQPANSSPQPANSSPQPVKPPKAPGTSAARPKRKATKPEIAEFRKWAAKQSACPHGMPGGDQVGPDDIAPCPFCRAQRT